MAARRLRLLLLAVPAFAAACEIKTDENPTISILSPADGSVNDASSVLVTVDVDRFTLDPDVYPIEDTHNSVPFKGHWHLYLDRFFVDDEFSTSALLTNVDPGEHEIAAELVNQNHQYIHGTPIAFAYVEVPVTAPGLILEDPDHGDTIRSSSVDLSMTLENMVLDTNLGSANIEGHGHIHVAVDGGPAMEAASTNVTLTDIAPLNSAEVFPTITVELVQNDHSSFTTPVLDQAVVLVPFNAPRVAISTPAESATVGTSLSLAFAFANFELVDFSTAIAETNGQGHYHVLVDGSEVVDGFAPSPTTSMQLAPGDHTVRFELRSNQHDPLTPPVVDIVHVTAE